MEEVKRGRGRPRIDTHITEEYYPSRRQALNKMYLCRILGSAVNNLKEMGGIE